MTHETITWFEVTERLPDNDRLLLVGLPESDMGDWDTPSWIGFYDRDEDIEGTDCKWYAADGTEIEVVRWAEMPTGQATNGGAFEQLLELARKYASECADCNGTGRVPFTPQSDKTFQCPDCKDIRDVIAAAVSP
jgi:CxxC-x17-CxxC domain-containing protein